MKKLINGFLFGIFAFVFAISFSSCKEKESVSIEEYEVQSGVTYEEKIDELLSKFYEFESSSEGNLLSFTGSVKTEYNGGSVSYLSCSNDTLIKKYDTILDTETGAISLNISYLDDDIIVDKKDYEVTPYYDELADDYLFEFEGEVYSLASMIYDGQISECIAVVDDAAIIGGCAVLIGGAYILTCITQDPVFQKNVSTFITQVTETITSFVKSFLSWFKSIFKAITTTIVKTVTTTIETIKTIYRAKVAGIDFEFVEVNVNELKNDGSYYLALADTTRGGDGKAYLSTIKVDRNFAVAVLRSSQLIGLTNSLGNSADVLLSTYTYLSSDAMSIAEEASINGCATYHPAHYKSWKTGVYFDHYHPCSPYTTSAHSFFGIPKVA